MGRGRKGRHMGEAWNSHDVPAAERADFMRQGLADTIAPFDIEPHEPLENVFGWARVADVGAVRVVEIEASDAHVIRTSKLIRRSDLDLCKIDVQLRGRTVFEQYGRQACLDPGDFVFIDLSRPCRLITEDSNHACVIFPRALLPIGPDAMKEVAGVTFRGREPGGSLVSSLVREMVRDLDEYDGMDPPRVGTVVVDLIAAALAARAGSEGALPIETHRRALIRRIHTFIEDRLGHPELAPGAIAAAHHISTRYLHRLFEPQGTTVASWIRHRRLARCRRDLLDPAFRSQPVSAIGMRWGFGDPAHFSRAFRAEYGVPPSEYRASMQAGDDAQTGPRGPERALAERSSPPERRALRDKDRALVT
jgi:AraC-like DNA-binding protein